MCIPAKTGNGFLTVPQAMKNLKELDNGGNGKIKRTTAQNYFTWVVGIQDPQSRYLIKKMKSTAWKKLYLRTPRVQVSFFEAMYQVRV